MDNRLKLRDYQLQALEAISDAAVAGIQRQLICLPTGSGKTIVMSALAKQLNRKTLLLAHREELITQALDKFKLFWPFVKIGICMAERNEIGNQVVIGSVQSCSRPKRLELLKEQGFDLMMIDEAHHASSESYRSIIEALGFGYQSKKLLIGVTATPQRSDNNGLGTTFEKLVFSRSIGTMIKAGYLSPVIGRKILTNFSMKGIRSYNGDFSLCDLAETMNSSERNTFIVDKFQEYAKDRKAVAFCVDVQHCKDLAEAFKKAGITAAAVWGDMLADERKKALEDLKYGRIQVVTSCGVLTEGFDEPSIDAVIMARPTKSHSLYIQCVGRGLRLFPGKQNCLVLDFTDRSNNLESIMTLSGAIPEAAESKVERSKEEEKEVDKRPKIMVLEEVDREFDILGTTRFMWIAIGDEEWSLIDDEKNEIVMSPTDSGYIARLHRQDGTTQQIVRSPLPIEYCSGVCEDYARRHLKIAFADMKAPWMRGDYHPTQGQQEYLEKYGVYRHGMTKAEATIEIRRVIALKNKQRRISSNEPLTQMQRYFLVSRGFDTSKMTRLQAIQTIAKIKQNTLS